MLRCNWRSICDCPPQFWLSWVKESVTMIARGHRCMLLCVKNSERVVCVHVTLLMGGTSVWSPPSGWSRTLPEWLQRQSWIWCDDYGVGKSESLSVTSGMGGKNCVVFHPNPGLRLVLQPPWLLHESLRYSLWRSVSVLLGRLWASIAQLYRLGCPFYIWLSSIKGNVLNAYSYFRTTRHSFHKKRFSI